MFQSPKCPRWTLPTMEDVRRQTPNCQSSMLQGRRAHQEDRTVCALDLRIPFPGQMGVKEVSVGMIAVFDGHNGAEASEMASKLLLEYFFLHIYFLLDGIYSFPFKKSSDRLLHRKQHDVIFQGLNLDKDLESHRIKLIYPQIFNGAFHKEILKESLLRTIRDIDATFFKEAYKNNLESGSTATIVLIADGQILVANVGDSKALLCSERFLSTQEFKGTLSKLHRRRRRNNAVSLMRENENSKLVTSGRSTYFCVRELTEDHHPDRDDERTRVEAAGGYVIEWGGVPRVNGELALSRAIGDVSFRSYGVIPVPEVTDWQPLTGNDSYLVAATDGVFEKLTTQDICDILWDVHMHGNGKSEFCSTGAQSLADCIVNTAFAKGSMDNIAAVVVPLRSSGVPRTVQNERCDLERVHSSASELPNLIHLKSANDATGSGLIPMEFVQQITAKFNKLLVEGEQNKFGCFYLSESLNENLDYVFLPRTDDEKIGSYDPAESLAEFHGHPHSGGTLGLYNDQNLCLHFGMDLGGGEGQCINPEGFARFLGLLESVPFYDRYTGFNSSASVGYETPNFRYILKRRFDRGSYGEVWLACHWNCSQNGDALNQMSKSKTSPVSILCLDPHNLSVETNSSQHQCFNDTASDDLFILKRIMVERGTNAYLSGLREKYFGEVFLNASLSLGGLLSASSSKFYQKEAEYDDSDLLKRNESLIHEMGNIWNPSDIFMHNSRLLTADHEEGLMHIARYIESFESRLKEIWLVFRNEGLSLSKLIYTPEETKISSNTERDEYANNIQVMHPSQWWHWLRTTEEGKMEMRNLIWQLLLALKSCHDRNITHRDIKPGNMVVCFEDQDTGRCLRGSPNGGKHYHIKMRIIDFGSAIDDFTIKNLYGSNGPSRSEETFEYTPPEALLNYSWFQGPPSLTLKYDMWSVGVVMLELIVGSPHVFQISTRTRALLDKHLEGWSEEIKELAFKLRSFMEMCILIPGSSPQNHWDSGLKDHSRVWPASWKCSEEFFSQQVKSRDPLKLGFPNVWAMRLVRQLLVWHPEDRLSVDDALRHPYFQSYPQTWAA